MKQRNYFISKEELTEEQESKKVLSQKRAYIDIPKQRNELESEFTISIQIGI